MGSKSGKYILNFRKMCQNIVSSKPVKTCQKTQPIEILQGFDTLWMFGGWNTRYKLEYNKVNSTKETCKVGYQASKTASTLVSHKLTRPRPLLTMRPFFKGQNNQKFCLSFCHSLVSHLTSLFCTIYCIEFWFFVWYSIPQTFTVYQTLAISLLAMFFGEFLGFLGLNSTFFQLGGQFQVGQDCFN